MSQPSRTWSQKKKKKNSRNHHHVRYPNHPVDEPEPLMNYLGQQVDQKRKNFEKRPSRKKSRKPNRDRETTLYAAGGVPPNLLGRVCSLSRGYGSAPSVVHSGTNPAACGVFGRHGPDRGGYTYSPPLSRPHLPRTQQTQYSWESRGHEEVQAWNGHTRIGRRRRPAPPLVPVGLIAPSSCCPAASRRLPPMAPGIFAREVL
jgi:hypothetical protein